MKNYKKRRPTVVDKTGMVVGRLTVLEKAPTPSHIKNKVAYWKCICECGEMTVVQGGNLTSGRTSSCGCGHLDQVRELGKSMAKHHMRDTPEYSTWAHMKQRCLNQKNDRYQDYGGRGITLCDRWHDFQKFYEDMGPRPTGKTLDRIDNNGNYEPGNCKWSTPTEQALNTRPVKRKLITHNGVSKTIIDWARDVGIGKEAMRQRIELWGIEKALTTPKQQGARNDLGVEKSND